MAHDLLCAGLMVAFFWLSLRLVLAADQLLETP